MFTEAQETELRELHIRYANYTRTNYPHAKVFTFPEIVSNVAEGMAEGDTDYYTNCKGVLEAMCYTSENAIEEMIERAEADLPRRMMEMTGEQLEACQKVWDRMVELEKKYSPDGLAKE